jgi:hypothetical protein
MRSNVITNETFAYLRQLGLRKGGLLIDDLNNTLPVDALPTEVLADLIVRLEEAGVAVEIDSALLTPRRDASCAHKLATGIDRTPSAAGANKEPPHLTLQAPLGQRLGGVKHKLNGTMVVAAACVSVLACLILFAILQLI